MKSVFSAIIAVAAAPLLALAFAIATPAYGDVIAPLDAYVGRLRTIQVEINGHPARFLFDTGAGVTSLSPALASDIGCTPSGRLVGFRMSGEQVEFQRCPPVELRIEGMSQRREIGVFDVNALLPEGLPHLDGILGLDAFEGERITILTGLRGLRIERSSGRRPRGAREGVMRIANESGGAGLSVFVATSTDEPRPWLLLDSANLAGLLLHPSVRQVVTGESENLGATTFQLSVAGADTQTVSPTISNELIYDGALDAAFIAEYDVTIDLGNERIWWRRAQHHSP